MNIHVIVRADRETSFSKRKQTAEKALEAGYTAILFRKGDESLADIGKITALIRDNETISGSLTGNFVSVSHPKDLEKAYAAHGDILIVECSDWKIIPLENLIAHFSKTNLKIYFCVSDMNEAKLALQIMESGVFGICINGEDIAEFTTLPKQNLPEIRIEEAQIHAVTPLNLGDRICIDTCSLMSEGTSMFIGSQSSALFLVCSESFACGYVAPRPFRVNAGAVHSYILTPDGTTRYLSELKSGSSVLVRNADAKLREVSVGRIKCEVRPLLLIEAEVSGKPCSVILQNAETIRLAAPDGPKQITKLTAGDKVYVRIENGGRHFGQLLTETISET